MKIPRNISSELPRIGPSETPSKYPEEVLPRSGHCGGSSYRTGGGGDYEMVTMLAVITDETYAVNPKDAVIFQTKITMIAMLML
ncbi:hypothetical protein F2Q68_00007835 [Brassica cretica]|uniref:Uncharacterized protein n=1 Tax=Brassica cretica TaxID=69181 RepID=A0A8S9KYZ4_BRACR|nr:hypothetical protein F2Q68_00007835 [Brassica cretica]